MQPPGARLVRPEVFANRIASASRGHRQVLLDYFLIFMKSRRRLHAAVHLIIAAVERDAKWAGIFAYPAPM
jgi:hypothetical protein